MKEGRGREERNRERERGEEREKDRRTERKRTISLSLERPQASRKWSPWQPTRTAVSPYRAHYGGTGTQFCSGPAETLDMNFMFLSLSLPV